MKRLLFTLAAGASLTASLALSQTLPREVWTHNYSSTTHDLAGGGKHRVLTTDPAGSAFVGSEAPKLAAPFDTDLVITKYDRCAGGPVWVRTFDYLGANRADRIVAMDTDGAGNLYVAAEGNNGAAALWVLLKFDPNGTLLWTQTYGGVNNGTPVGLKVDKAGWVAVAGTMQTGGNNYVHALKLDPFSSAMGAVGISPLIGGGALAKALAVDAAGNILVAADATVAAIPRCVTLRFPGLLTAPAVAAPTFQIYAPAGGRAYAQGIVCDSARNRLFTLAGAWIGADQVAVLCSVDAALLPPDATWNAGAAFLKPIYGTSDKARAIAVSPSGRVVTLAETFTGYSDMLVSQWDVNGLAYFDTDSGMGLPDTYALYDHVQPAGLKVDVTGRIYITGTGYSANPPDFVTEAFSPLAGVGQLPDWYDIYNSTTLGGLEDDSMAIALDAARNVFVAGLTIGGGTAYTTAVMIGQGVPANDTCPTAMGIGFGTTAFTTYFATDTAPPVSPCGGNRKDVWFKWTAPCAGVVELDTYGSCFDTVLSVHTGNCGALVPVVCNDNAAAGRPLGTLQSYVNFTTVAGTTYYIQVAGGGGAVAEEGTGRLTLIGPMPVLGTCPPAAGLWSPWRKFRLMGVGTSAMGGTWRISVPCCTDVVGAAPTVLGAPAAALAANLSASINAACASFNSIAVGNQVWISTRCGATAPFVFRVGPAGTPPDQLCLVPDIDVGAPFYTSAAMSCSYNPTLSEEAYAHTDANNNNIPDILDIATGTSQDANQNGIPDETENLGPKLNLTVQQGGLQLAWEGRGFIVQSSATLGPQADWQNVTGATNSPVNVPINQTARFFRLSSQ